MTNCCGQGDVLLLACSGGCNVGQIANDAAKALDSLGQGTFYCSVGVALKLPAFVERSTKERTTIVALDGCPVSCVKKAVEAIGTTPNVHVVVTELGIEKAHRFDYPQDEVAKRLLPSRMH